MIEHNAKRYVGLILIAIAVFLYFSGYVREMSSRATFFCIVLGIWGLILFATAEGKK